MSKSVKNSAQPKYGSFVLAATAYISGVLLFSFWSYSAHQKALINQMDATLVDAAFSMQEILGADVTGRLAAATETRTETVSEKQQSLARLARHGSFSFVEVVSVRNETIIPLIAGLNPDTETAENSDNIHWPLPPDLTAALLSLATTEDDASLLITAAHPVDTDETVRYAIRYHAEGPGGGLAFLVARKRAVINQALADQALRLLAAGLGMLLLAIPLISLFSRTQKKAAEELSEMNIRLQHDVDLQQSREEELKDAISDLERFNAVSSGRETRIIELKNEVNELLQQLKRAKRYNIDKID